MRKDQALFDWRDGQAYFRGLRVERRALVLGGRSFELAALEDAAELLDLPDYADRFIQHDRAPYGLELWPAASMLAEHLLTEGGPPTGTAIEIGAGLGLVSVVASAAGWSVVATDREEEALRFAAHNAHLNGVRLGGYQILDWNAPPTHRRYACVLAADVLYQRVDHTPLLGCIDALLKKDGLAIVADPHRSVADRFAEEARARGFDVRLRGASADNRLGERVEGRLFFLRRIADRSSALD